MEFAVAPDEDQTKVDVALRSTRLQPDAFIEIKAFGHPDLKLSIQGFDAKKAADNLFRLAKLTNEELYIRLYWRDDKGAAHPGEEAVIHWRS